MRGKRKDLPQSFEDMEEYLLAAWERVKTGRPTNPELLERAKQGKLKATPSSVTVEAGVSRSLIGYEGCRYKNVRDLIMGKPGEVPLRVPTDMRTINSELRHLNKILEERLKLALSENAAMIVRMHRLEREFEDKEEEIVRINARGSRAANEIVGLHVVKAKSKKNE